MKKNQIVLLTFGIIFTIISLLLWILCVPENLPLLYNWKEEVIMIGSKWWLIIITVFPMLFSVLCFFSKNQNTIFLLKILFTLSVYEMFIILIAILTGTLPEVGLKPEIPLTCYLLLPISIIIMVLAIKLKTLPYNSKIGIRFKCTRETEFIWKQTHFFAKKIFFPVGFILLITSLIFSFFHYAIILLGIYILALIICSLIIYFYSKSIYNKYKSMKTKLDNLQKK